MGSLPAKNIIAAMKKVIAAVDLQPLVVSVSPKANVI
jgi:hypothetical protein